MIYSHSSEWPDCCQHEQEISILQQKLMEIHNKLIDQLDICKEQELTIIQLSRKISQSQNKTSHGFDTFKYQSFGQHSNSEKENQVPNFKVHYDHDSRQSHQTKTELLQADLEAMRNKVLAEITQKNRLKEDMKEIRHNHKRQLTMQSKKIDVVEGQLKRLQEENEQLKEKYDRVRRDYRSDTQTDKLTAKINQLELKYQRQREVSRTVQMQKRALMQKNQDLQHQIQQFERQESNRKRKAGNDNGMINQQQREIDTLKIQIQKLTKNIELRDSQFRQRGQQKKKKRGFEQTKQLIKKLQQTQSSMRRNRKQNP